MCIKDLPPAYPKAKVGKWKGVEYDENSFQCSWCEQIVVIDGYDAFDYEYCPLCGAKMEGVEE